MTIKTKTAKEYKLTRKQLEDNFIRNFINYIDNYFCNPNIINTPNLYVKVHKKVWRLGFLYALGVISSTRLNYLIKKTKSAYRNSGWSEVELKLTPNAQNQHMVEIRLVEGKKV